MPLTNPRVSRAVPIKVGGSANAGVGRLASPSGHVHPLIETSGPTSLDMGSWLDGEIGRRVGGNVVGRFLGAGSTTGSASSTVTTPTDVDSKLNFDLETGRVYLGLWLLSYSTANLTTGIMLAVNYTGTASASGLRMAVIMATDAAAMFSQNATTFDSLMGLPTVGPGAGTGRLALVYCRLSTTAPGVLALRYATGVNGSSVSVNTQSGGIVIQQ
jgi:hypothetical protein